LREFAARCLALVRTVGIKKVVVLLPSAIRLSAQDRQLLDARGVVLIALRPFADNGTLVVDLKPHVVGVPEDRPDGVYSAHTIVVAGTEYECDLSKREMDFMAIALRDRELELGSLIHRGQGALWKGTFSDTRAIRNKVTQFLSRLNKKLAAAKPQFPFFFSLPRGRRSIVRTSESDMD
jgi:hypothetical protein